MINETDCPECGNRIIHGLRPLSCYDQNGLPSIDILTEGYSVESNNPYLSLA